PPHSFGAGRSTWIVALRPDRDSAAPQQPPPGWAAVHRGPSARVGRPVAAVEDDTLLAFAPVATRDSTTWFGPRFMDFAVATPDSWPALRHAGIPLAGWWQRTALAWALQSPALARRATDGLVLLWRRGGPGAPAPRAPLAQPKGPRDIVGPGADGATAAPRVWMGQSFEAGTTFAVLVAATMALHGPRVFVWRPNPAPRLPPVLVGSPNTTAPGVPRLW